MFGIHWKQNVATISARLLRENLFYPRFLGFLFFRYRKDKDGLVILDDNRKWWKWLSLLYRIISMIGLMFSDSLLFAGFNSLLHQVFKYCHLGLVIFANFWITRHQFFNNTKAVFLANKMLKIFRRVRCLSNQKNVGFGGKKEFVLIILIMGCRVYEFISLFDLIFQKFELLTILTLWGFAYHILYINFIIHFHCLWYVALGVLHSELNEFMQNEVNNLHQPNFEVYLDIYRKIHESEILFKKMYSNQLLLYFFSSVLYIVDVSNLMIKDLSIRQPWMWILFLKIIIENQLFCSAVERIFQELEKTRSIIFELSIVKDTKENNQAVEMFITFLNLNPFRVQIFGLFEVSNSFHLKMVSNAVNYVIIVVQFVLQTKQM
ncbi:hypothetical protein KR067_013564 [Drosophila pandora]|nr:hypothetical protein KR067_013564 [Drosophila pandora]